jgi:hypothetical protein
VGTTDDGPTRAQVVRHFRHGYWQDIFVSLGEIRRGQPYGWRNLKGAMWAWFTWRWRVRI